jgi:hypothetical protein
MSRNLEEITLREGCDECLFSPRESPFCTCRFAVNVEYNRNTCVDRSEDRARFHPYARNIVCACILNERRGIYVPGGSRRCTEVGTSGRAGARLVR